MALKRKKLDAICAHLKKTSAVDVTTPTEHNGVNGGDGDIVAAVADDGGVDGVAGGGGVKDIVKPIITTSTTTNNNNEETVTDLNENPEPVSSETDPSNNENDSAKLPPPPESAEEEPSSSCLSPSAHFAKSLEDSTSTPTTTTPVLASSITTSISNTPTSSSNVPVSSLETSSDVSPPSSKAETSTSVPTPSASSTKIHGSGRRKSRKAAKPRSVFHPHPVDVEMYEGGSQVSMLGGGSVDDEGSSSFIMGEDLHNGVDSSEEFNDASSYAEREKRSSSPLPSSSSFASQYSSLLQQHQRVKQSIPNFLYPPSPAAGDGDGGGDDDDGDDDDDDGDDSSFNLTGVPLDLSTSRHSDNSEPSFFDNDDNDDETADHSSNSSTRPSSASSSPAPGQHPSYPPPSVSSTVVNAEAKVLADYAKNTMNELLSIYGFGTAGGVESVDKQLAQKQLENLSSLRALAAGTQGKISATPPAAHRVGGGGIKLSNGQPVHRDASASTSNVSSSSEGISNSISALGLVSTDEGQLKKPNGNSTKFKFHNVKPSLKHSFGNTGFHQKVSSSDYSKYIKKFHSGADCGGNHCRDLGYRDHYHCHDCNFKVFIKKEEMVRHYKWHKKRDESLQHGFLRFSPLDDCTVKYGSCTHNKRQTHYHCVQAGCDKVYISTSDVQMHANYHRKDSAIIQEGFQRFRATEDCGTTTCSFYGQRTTHFHCRRPSCNFTFKNKADMEKHKSYHQKDEILGRDGFKKFMKYEHCSFQGCRFSKVSNHIHCIRPGCCYVLHSTAQLYSHKRKHERREFENLYRTFRQAQRPQVQPSAAPAQRSGQQNPRPLAPAVAGIPAGAVSLGTKVNLTSIPIGSYGEPMVARTVVAGQLMQPMSIPIKIGAGGAILAPNVSVVSAGAQTLPIASAAAAIMEAKPLALTTPSSTQTKPTASSSAGAANKAPAITIKQEPKSEGESDTESQSVTKSTGTSPLPFSLPANLETVKSENLNDSLNLAIPVSKEAEEALKQGVVVKSVAESGIGTDGASPVGGKESSITMTLLPPMKRAGAPEKRERDETWKNYLIRYTANDPCNSRCQLLYKDHYHCKIQGCMVLFRSKDGVREHAKFHDLQDRITPMVYDKYDSDIACPHLNCQFCRKEMHYHCNFTGCSHAVADQGQTFARLEHYRIHEFARAAAGKNYRVQSGAGTTVRMDDLAHRRRGRPPKYPRLDIPSVPKVELTEQEIRESSQRTLDGEGAGADERIINGFRKFDAEEECPNDQCIYRGKLHYHCGRPRCHTATDRIDVLNLHAKDFHCFVKILEHFEFFDRNVNCRRSHCNNNGTNRHYHCTRPRCDYSFVRHSTMTQHDKKHNSDVSSSSSSSASAVASSTPLSPGTRITPIQLLRRPDGQTYFPIIPAPAAAALDKSVVKASGTFYPLSALGTSVSGTTVTMVSSAGQALSSGLTLTIPANLMTAGIPVMASMASTSTASSTATNMVPIIAGNVISSVTGAVTSAVPLTVLLQQKSANGMPQPSWSAMRSSMHYSLQASCGRPFCKLKKKDHYHCLECNQAFSDPARLRSHISKHGVKFKKLAQSPSKANIQAPIFLPAAAIKAAGQVMSQGGLDLSKAKLKDSQAEKARAEEGVGGQGEEMVEDDNDSLSSSLNLSVGNFASLTQGDNTVTSASETNDESSLIIDEGAVHSDDESTAMDESINGNEDDGEDEDDMLSTSDISLMAGTSAASSPTTSRRSGRKRSAPKNDDFVTSDDASLLAKQMKLKLSAPIPSSTPAPPVTRKVPDGFIRFHCSNDCGYLRCAYRQSVTHYHCVRRECGYGFSDKSRILQHQFRHERLDKLMGEEFQQYRATVGCGQEDCEFSEKASHFHCQKCTFVCADSSKVLAHRKYHAKMDNISSNGFQKFGALQRCEIPMCAYSRKQTHYHCTHDGCNHAVLGPAQMAPHKLKHASHDV